MLQRKRENIKRIHAFVSGKVQGVFFRYHTVKKAKKEGLKGWVRNTEDDRVEAVAEGGKEALEDFISFLWEGSPQAEVEDVRIEWQEPEGESDFFVK